MDNTSFLPGFKPQGGRRRISAKEQLFKEQERLKKYQIRQYRNLFKGLLPFELFKKNETSQNSRDRIFTFEVTFWAFLTQIYRGGSSCQEGVKAVQSWLKKPNMNISSNTAAYCKARLRMEYFKVFAIFCHVAKKASTVSEDKLWCGRSVKMIDGTSVRAPDTVENQVEWPQPSEQKEGCGFPVIQLQGLVCAASGVLLDWVETKLTVSDSKAWKGVWKFLSSGDIILGDRAYGSYAAFSLLKQQGVDMLTRMNSMRKLKRKDLIRLGKNDYLTTWKKPVARRAGMTKQEWAQVDNEMTMRITKYNIIKNGFRTKTVMLSTTLLNPELYPAEALAELYGRRWGIEVRFRDIKTTMEMNEMKGRSPYMVRLEIVMMGIAYNLSRALINKALEHDNKLMYERVSFAGTLSQIRQHLHNFDKELSIGEHSLMMKSFLHSLIDAPVPDRPGRSEPRAKKRRYKKYKIMNKKRAEMVVEPHRDKYRKTG
jgi:hypothetical protein